MSWLRDKSAQLRTTATEKIALLRSTLLLDRQCTPPAMLSSCCLNTCPVRTETELEILCPMGKNGLGHRIPVDCQAHQCPNRTLGVQSRQYSLRCASNWSMKSVCQGGTGALSAVAFLQDTNGLGCRVCPWKQADLQKDRRSQLGRACSCR
jgi:hypothetical protein